MFVSYVVVAAAAAAVDDAAISVYGVVVSGGETVGNRSG